MAGFSVKTFQNIVSDMITWIVANQDKITDFNEGSVIRSFVEAVGSEVESGYIAAKIGFAQILKDVPSFIFGFEKQVAEKSAGDVVFSRTGTTGTVSIATGTIVATTDGVRFETNASGEISNGNTSSSSIGITAIDAGKDGNVPAGTIIVIETPIEGIENVTNAAVTTGGLDEESDAQFLKRFQETVLGFGGSNPSGIVAKAKGVAGVRSAKIKEHFPPISNYNFTVYVEDGAGNAPQEMIDAVTLVIMGDGSELNMGNKACGIKCRVLAPSKVTQNVNVTLVKDPRISSALIEFNVKEAIQNYIDNLELGDDIIWPKIVQAIMKVQGVLDCTLSTPSANVTINEDQIARTGVITVL